MTLDYEEWCRAGDPVPFICSDCGAAFDPDDNAEIEAHRDEHWIEFLRAQCPIPDEIGALERLVQRHGYDHGLKIAGIREWPPTSIEEEEDPF